MRSSPTDTHWLNQRCFYVIPMKLRGTNVELTLNCALTISWCMRAKTVYANVVQIRKAYGLLLRYQIMDHNPKKVNNNLC